MPEPPAHADPVSAVRACGSPERAAYVRARAPTALTDSETLCAALPPTLDLLQWPHPQDGAMPGSTMARGIDTLRAWCTAAAEVWRAPPPPRGAPFPDAPLQALLCERLVAAMALPHTTTVNRVRGLLDAFLGVYEAQCAAQAPQGERSAPPAERAARPACPLLDALLAHARSHPDTQATLVALDTLVARYGTCIATEAAPEGSPEPLAAFFAAVVRAVRQARGSVSRRSKLAISLISAVVRERGTHGDAWLHPWLTPLAEALVDRDERAVDHVVAHLVYPLLDTVPGALPHLLGRLAGAPSDADAVVRAGLAVLRGAKLRDLCTLEPASSSGNATSLPVRVPASLLDACLRCSEPRIQVAALALAVDAKTPAAPFTPVELAAVSHFYTENLMLASSVARKDTIAYFVKLLTRVRINLHGLHKRRADDALQSQLEALLAHLASALVMATHPGAPYACTILAVSLLLLLLEATLEGVTDAPAGARDVGDAVRSLQKTRSTYPGAFAVHAVRPSTALVDRLLQLVTESTYDDVQRTAVLVLERLGAAGQLPGLDTPQLVCERAVGASLARMRSLKESDADAAVLLVQLYQRLVVVWRWPGEEAVVRVAEEARRGSSSVTGADDGHADDVVSGDAARGAAPFTPALLAAHLSLLTKRLQTAEQRGIDRASQEHALHGLLAVIEHLVACAQPEQIAPLVAELRKSVRRVWSVTRPVLCAAAPEGNQDAARGEANAVPQSELENAMLLAGEEAGDADDEEGDAALAAATPAYQRILAYAWRAIKEAARLEARLVEVHADAEAAEAANALFLDWMLHIRHRGAFSTIYPCYTSMVRAVLRARSPVAALPDAWLDALLEHLEAHCEQFSTTRRSAGIGYAFLALLSAHGARGAPARVERAMGVFLRMAAAARGDDAAAPTRTTHALNMVRVLVMDSTLTAAMRAYLGAALTQAVAGFRSAHWSVRNASMMLFAAISTRFFGIRAFGHAPQHERHLDELLATSHELERMLADTAASESQALRTQDLCNVAHGSALYAVLLLLGKLRPESDALDAGVRRRLLEAVERCATCANWKIREQAAACYAVLVPEAERGAAAARLLEQATLRDQNGLHGALLAVRALVARAAPAAPATPDVAVEQVVAPVLARRSDELLGQNACPPTCAAFLDVVTELGSGPATSLGAGHAAAYLTAVLELLAGGKTADVALRPDDPFLPWLVPSALRAAPVLGVEAPLERLLQAKDAVRRAVLEHLAGEAPTALLPALLDLALDAQAALDVRVAAAELAARPAEGHPAADATHARRLLSAAVTSGAPALRDALIPLLGVAAGAADAAFLRACLAVWERCSRAEQGAASRLGVAHALGYVVPERTASLDAALQMDALRLVARLLTDDDAEVRAVSCALASRAFAPAGRSDAPSAALGPLLRSARQLQGGHLACAEWIWEHMRQVDAAALADELGELLTGQGPPSAAPGESRERSLFPSEEYNQFYDPFVDVLRAYRWLASAKVPVPPGVALDAPAHAGPAPSKAAYLAALQRALRCQLGRQDAHEALAALLVEPGGTGRQAGGQNGAQLRGEPEDAPVSPPNGGRLRIA